MDKKNITKYAPGLPLLALWLLLAASCGGGEGGGPGGAKLANGYYTAEAAAFNSHGWKEYITIYVDNNNIVTVDYDAKNASGFPRSWDMDYMRSMVALEGRTYPTAYGREYSMALLRLQQPEGIDALAGATESYKCFKILAATAISQARANNKEVALVELPAH